LKLTDGLPREGKTPICYSLNSKVLKTLVDAGADATVIDNDGWNVLMNILANPSRYKRELGNFQI
jgi:ankyrin repeat protein